MAGSHTMVTQLGEAYRRWEESRGESVETWMALIDEDIEFGSVLDGRPGAEFMRTHRGKDAIRGYFESLSDGWTMNFYKVHDFIADGDKVVMFGRTSWTCNATGRKVNTPKIDCWWFRDGKAVRFFEMYDTAAVLEAMA